MHTSQHVNAKECLGRLCACVSMWPTAILIVLQDACSGFEVSLCMESTVLCHLMQYMHLGEKKSRTLYR